MKRTITAAIIAGSLALAACSSSGKGGGATNSGATSSGATSSGATSSGTTSTGKAASGTPFVLGTVGSYSGSESSSIGLVGDAANVWAKWVNDNGGINGHPVKLIVKDDGLDPAKSLQAVQELVQQDHVQAIIGEHSQVDNSWQSYIEKAGVPVIGGNPTQPTMLSSSDFFPIGTSVPAMLAGEFKLMAAKNLKKFGMLYCAEAPVCATLGALAKGIAPTISKNISVAYTGKIAATDPSYVSDCAALKSAGVDTLMTADAVPIGIKVASDCSSIGYKPQQLSQSTTAGNAWLQSSFMQGTLLIGPDANFTDSSTPGVATFLNAIKKYEPSMLTSPQFDGNDLWAWAGGMMFKTVAEAAHLTPSSTPAQVKQAMYTVKNETLDGITPPLTYTPNKPTLVSCYFTLSVQNNEFVSENGDKPTCLSPAEVQGLGKVLAGG